MKKRALALILAASLLTVGLCSCGRTDAENGEATKSTENVTSAATEETEADIDLSESVTDKDYTTGSPWIASNIESNVDAAGKVDLKDHFDLAVNGDWVKENQIKTGDYENAYIISFEETLKERLLNLMKDESKGDLNTKLVHTLYSEFLDWDKRDAAGAKPLKPYLNEIEEIQSISDLDAYIAKGDFKFSDMLNWSSFVSPKDASKNILAVGSLDRFLNDAADYKDLDNMSDYTRQVYDCNKKRVETVLLKCGYTNDQIDKIYDDAISLEKLMAEKCYTNDDLYLTETDDIINEQIYTQAELEGYHWFTLLEKSAAAYGLKELPEVILYEKKDFFENYDEILSEKNLELIKNYMLAHTAASAIGVLDKETYYKGMDIRNELLGSTGYKEESEYAVNTVSSLLEWPLAKLYCDQYVTKEDKQNVHNLIDEIIKGYSEMLQKEDFLSDATKQKAVEKLDKMQINCMYPDDWSKYAYDNLELSESYFDSVIEIQQYKIKKMVDTFYDPVERSKWDGFTPITQNAFYDPQRNSINILPGFIGDVLYNSDMPKEEVYGKLGAIIGHEISHAFDPSGASYDAEGNRNNWWTDEDKEKFKEKTDKMVAYYNSIKLWGDVACNGELCKGEACADMGGIAVLLRLAADDPDFDYALLFKSYARTWATNATPENIYYNANYDAHPVCYLRVNVTVAQFDEFYDTFDIKEGDGMYIAPEDRVKIW